MVQGGNDSILVIASGTKWSVAISWDCFVASLLAMTRFFENFILYYLITLLKIEIFIITIISFIATITIMPQSPLGC